MARNRKEEDKKIEKMEAVVEKKEPGQIGSYFLKEKEHITYLKTGSRFLDLILGGGFPQGRVINLIGDSGSGKTLIAIETSALFLKRYPDGIVKYHEGEGAFDEEYARAIALPEEGVDFVNENFTKGTMVHWREELEKLFKTKDPDQPCLYIVDSYDSFTLDGDATEGYDQAKKAAALAALLADYVKKFRANNTTLIIISQVREVLNALPGQSTKRRTGGKALKHYSSQEIWIVEKGKETKVISGRKETIGLHVYAKCSRNKVGLEYRYCDFWIRFGFGIDNILTALHYLKEIGKLEKLGYNKTDLEGQTRKIYADPEWRKVEDSLYNYIETLWWEKEKELQIPIRKY